MLERVELERLEIGQQMLVDMSTLRQSLELQSYVDHMLNQMVYDLRGYVLAEEIDNRTTTVRFQLDIPANWWEHFKRDILQRFFRGRLNIKFQRIVRVKKVTFRKLATYPKANIALPELGNTVIYRNQFLYEDNH